LTFIFECSNKKINFRLLLFPNYKTIFFLRPSKRQISKPVVAFRTNRTLNWDCFGHQATGTNEQTQQEASNLISFYEEPEEQDENDVQEEQEESEAKNTFREEQEFPSELTTENLSDFLNVSTQNLMIKNRLLENAYHTTNEKTQELRLGIEKVSFFIAIQK
jgi:hypothetical protein